MAWISKSRLEALDFDYRTWSSSRIAHYQLERINDLWGRASRSIPYYKRLASNGLPESFNSLQEYITMVPPLTKRIIQNMDVPYWHGSPRPDGKRVTGGSTAKPVQIPAWRREYEENRLDPWLGRSWYGIDPNDRLLLYWGHVHLLGKGWRGKVNGRIRLIKDWIQNYRRFSCYDMSEIALENAGKYLLKSKAKFIIGYSCYLDRLAEINSQLSPDYAVLDLKAVIGAAEGFPFGDSQTRIKEVFHAPVGMEYGSVETGLIAHTHPSGGYRVFWKNYLLEYSPGSALQEVFVTSLFPRCTPLFRYKLGDFYEISDESRWAMGCSILSFNRVIGRSNMTILLPNGRSLHSETISHIVRDVPKISGYQAISWKDQVILHVTTNKTLKEKDVKEMYSIAQRIDPQFGECLRIR